MLSRFLKAFTLVEMLVALAVSSIIIAASYASYEMVATQYKKNMDVADMHTSGRAIMRIIERDIRMAGFEYRDKDAKITYGTISNPLTIKDSGNKCCDEVTVIYDYFDEESKKAERIRIRYWAEPHTSNKGSRHRLYKQKDILGRNKKILAKPKLGTKDVMADYIEDLQIGKGKGQPKPRDKMFQWRLEDGGNGSWYEHVDTHRLFGGNGSRITWTIAKGLAEASTFNGIQGHLATLTSKAEIDFICNEYKRHTTSYWTSKYGHAQKWVGGYQTNKTDEPKGNWVWVTGEPVAADFPWMRTYPKNRRGMSDYMKIEMHFNPCQSSDVWNEGEGSHGEGYIIEYDVVKEVVNALVGINLTLRTKNQYGKDRQFKKKDYHAGNYKLDKTDKFKRDTFSTTVLVRNLAL
jgi:prepilin-type N-terminal cleavage/methylation domain-containing protein